MESYSQANTGSEAFSPVIVIFSIYIEIGPMPSAIPPAHRGRITNRFESESTAESSWHVHAGGQFILVESGISHLRTEIGSWIIPTRRVGWVPPRLLHASRSSGRGKGWAIRAPTSLSGSLPAQVSVLRASALLMAALERIAHATAPRHASIRRLLWRVVAAEMRQAEPEALLVPMPSDPRMRATAERLLSSPGIGADVTRAANLSGMTRRTFTRHFRQETGMSFARWKRAAIAHHALERIAAGQKVSSVAFDVGYSSVSAFVAMMHRQLGAAPREFLSQHGEEYLNLSHGD
jgi:AraC-like DNA-binding protein